MQYPRQSELTAHVLALVAAYGGLHPQQQLYNYDDGRVELLVSLTGVVPAVVRGTTYNCPLAIWLPLDYPAKPPILYILPTSKMQIKRTANVDPGGKVAVPYLDDWSRKGEGFSLVPLVEILCDLFSKDYPLVSLPPPNSNGTAFPQSTSQRSPNPPLPPYPYQDQSTSRGTPPPPAGPPSRPPVLPHYARPHVPGARPDSYQGGVQEHQRRDSGSSRMDGAPPARPPLPPNFDDRQSPYGNRVPSGGASYNHPPPPPTAYPNRQTSLPISPQSTGSASASYRPQPPPPLPSSLISPPLVAPNPYQHPLPVPYNPAASLPPSSQPQYQPPVPNAQYSAPPTPYNHPNFDHHARQIPPQSPSQPSQSPYPPSAVPAPESRYPYGVPSSHPPPPRSSLPKPRALPAPNILDGPDDFAPVLLSTSLPPPLPPSPDLLSLRFHLHTKLASSHHHLTSSTTASLHAMQVLHADLLKGEPAIVDEMQRLKVVRDVCENVRDRYRSVVLEGESRLREYEARGEGPEVDEIVCSSTVVFNQLLDLVAEDAALEDTIYHLGRGLNSETTELDLEPFLKRVRALAREQFGKRALLNKILVGLAARRQQRNVGVV